MAQAKECAGCGTVTAGELPAHVRARASYGPETCAQAANLVSGWSPYATVSGLTAVADLSALREEAFSNVVITFRGLDKVGNKAFAEWLIEADHTGPLVLGEDAVVEATGRHVQLPGVTVADFRDGKIRFFRTYFDDLSLIEQIAGA